MAALVCRPPPAFIHFIPMLWAVLACVAILHTGGYYWNHLEPCGTPRILLDVHGCTGVQVPPFHTFYLEPPGTYTTLGFSWMCPAPWRSSTESKSSSWGIVATVRNGTQEAGPRRGSARLPRLPRLGGTQIPAAPSTCVSSRGAVG